MIFCHGENGMRKKLSEQVQKLYLQRCNFKSLPTTSQENVRKHLRIVCE